MNVFLSQTELLKSDTSSNLDLSSNDIDTGNLFSDGVLDLDSGVDFDKVVSALLINEELGRTGVSVFDGSCELEGIVKDSLSDRFVKMGSGCDLDNLVSAFVRV